LNIFSGLEDSGALGFLFGFVRGSGSLVEHISSGVMLSISGFSGGTARILRRLASPSQTSPRRTPLPTSFGSGVAQGLSILYNSIGEAAVGLISKPVRGGQQEGITGFAQGVSKGILGVFAIPLSGALDFV